MRKTRKRKRSFRRVKWLALILVVIIAVAFGCSAAIKGNPSSHEIGDTDHQIVHVMIMGVDSRKDDVGRSDTLMVASIDQTAEKAALLSIPRDTRVAIEGHGYDKVNHAYAYGGHTLTQKSVEQLLGVPMDHYIISIRNRLSASSMLSAVSTSMWKSGCIMKIPGMTTAA